MNGTEARTSCDGVLTEIRGDRVCGAANGYAPSPNMRVTPSSTARSPTASENRCHAMSGSGPVSSTRSWPAWSRPIDTLIRDHCKTLLSPSRSSIVGRLARKSM